MEDNKNLKEELEEKEEIISEEMMDDTVLEEKEDTAKDNNDSEEESEYYFTAAELRKQKKRQEQRLKRVAKEEKLRNRNTAKMYKSSAIIAVFAGIMQILIGLPKENGMTNIMLGATFICCGYLFFNMGKKVQREKEKENR